MLDVHGHGDRRAESIDDADKQAGALGPERRGAHESR